jgi:fatty-acyl-CoA synthase
MNDWTEVVTFGDLVVRGAERWPDSDALVIDDDRRTYGEVATNAFAVARSLHGLGVSRGDHVGLLVPNCVAGVEVMFGAALLGAVVVPINVRFKSRELGHVIADGDLRVLVTSDVVADRLDFVALLHETLPGLADADDPRQLDLVEAPELRAVVLLGGSAAAGFLGAEEFAAAGEGVDRSVVELVRRRAALRDPAIMIYTSGTTAMPKGAPLSHEALVRTAVEAGRTRFRFVPGDRFWDPLPMFHMSFILPLIGVLDAGGAFISMVHFEPSVALAQLAAEGVTAMFPTFPAVTQALLNHPDYRPETLAKVRITNNVAPPDTLRAMQAAMPDAVQISAYGLTECGGVVSFNDPDDTYEQRMTTQGRPFAGIEVCAKDPEDRSITLPPGERGELCVRGYNLFEGYYKDPERTAAAFDDAGWFHTGDLGIVDADGRISYQGRLKDMLKVGGENVAAIEIESYLATHPAVSIAQVVGVPDEKYIEVAAAFLELKPGASVTEDEIIAFCSGAMASFKVPRYVRVVTEWPMSATKVQKFRLRDQLVEDLSEAAR